VAWALFFVVGIFNNFGYVVIISAAKTLADHFNDAGLIGVITWALIGVGVIAKFFNAFYLENVSHRLRIYSTSLMFLTGYILLTSSLWVDFWFAVFCIVIVGAGASFGESVMLGYLKLFPAELTGAWSSGTGFAGLAGSLLYLLFADVFSLSNAVIFGMMIPTAVFYAIAFEVTWISPLRSDEVISARDDETLEATTDEERDALLPHDEVPPNETFYQRLRRCFLLTWYRNLMLCLVYWFEYVVSVGLAEIANTSRSDSRQDRDYEILVACYQAGVFISRSSMSVVKLNQFGWMTALQFGNFILWHFHCEYNLFSEYVQFVLMVFVGLLGGAMYVNVMYDILVDKTIPNRDREFCINLASISVNIGITLSSVYDVIMDYTFFEHLVNQSDT
jgi:battenin